MLASCHLLGQWWRHSASQAESDGMVWGGHGAGEASWGLGGSIPVERKMTEGSAKADGKGSWSLEGSTPVE